MWKKADSYGEQQCNYCRKEHLISDAQNGHAEVSNASFLGDSEDTPAVIGVRRDGSLRVIESTPGDGTVTRDSAVMDERVGSEWQPFLQSPIAWRRVQFIFEDHLGLTRNPTFTDNLLFMLLESAPSGIGPTEE